MKDMPFTFYGLILDKDPTVGYWSTRFANGADVVLYQTGTKAWVATLYIGPTGNGVLVHKTRARSAKKALEKLEKKVEEMVRDFAAVAAKHFKTLAKSLAAVCRSGPPPRSRAKSRSSRSSSSKGS